MINSKNTAITRQRPSSWAASGWADVLDKVLSNDISSHDWFETYRPFEAKNPSFPPYNIIKEKDGEYKIEMALAGLSKKNVEVILDNDILTVSSIKEDSDVEEGEDLMYVHRGIAKREFSSKFRLPEYSEVSDCKMKDGVLMIQVSRNIPEEKLPKVVKIT